jgi:hypothetical protein
VRPSGRRRGHTGTDPAFGCSQLKTYTRTQTDNPIWNQILTFQIQVQLLFMPALPPLSSNGREVLAVVGGVWAGSKVEKHSKGRLT